MLSVTAPKRGQWTTPGEPVQVAGTAIAATAPVGLVRVFGADVSSMGDAFMAPIAPAPGVNVVGIRAEATDGERSVDGRAFFGGPVHAPNKPLDNAIIMHLSAEFLDDDDAELNDLAAIAESLLTDPELLASFDQPFDSEFAAATG